MQSASGLQEHLEIAKVFLTERWKNKPDCLRSHRGMKAPVSKVYLSFGVELVQENISYSYLSLYINISQVNSSITNVNKKPYQQLKPISSLPTFLNLHNAHQSCRSPTRDPMTYPCPPSPSRKRIDPADFSKTNLHTRQSWSFRHDFPLGVHRTT